MRASRRPGVGRTDDEGSADRIDTLPKHVATATLKQLDWNNPNLIAGTS